MSHLILIDEPAIRDCIESNIYQSGQFEAGLNLAKALSGDRTVVKVSPRIVPVWRRDTLYLLQSRVECGYLLISSEVFEALPYASSKNAPLEDLLHVFQRVCRFALKSWSGFTFAPSERWNQANDYGIVFPFPFSRNTSYRVVIRKGYGDRRFTIRHGSKHLFAFAGGSEEAIHSGPAHEQLYNRAFEDLTGVRSSTENVIQIISESPSDPGFHPLVLSDPNHPNIRYQSYGQWLSRLTIEQKGFVESSNVGPQRVEGPAGTGKTLCLILRAYFLCKSAQMHESECRVLFVSHSEETRNSISLVFDALGEPSYHRNERAETMQSIELCTLQQWCGSLLGVRDVSNAQYLDQDALQSKELRKLILKDVVKSRLIADKGSLEYLSEQAKSFFEQENIDYIAELLQHEIGVLIKGRASENLEVYIKLPALAYCLPTTTANDRRFVFSLYKAYQTELNQSGVFDTDDIVLTTLGRLDTPIWRRRKVTEGYDAVLIDETHLFNFNELAVFHHLLRNSEIPFIVFSIDRSQSPGERGITTRMVREVLTNKPDGDMETRTEVVFRSSPQIVRLAEAVTASGAALFTTFENPLAHASSVITASDEALAEDPIYWQCINDEHMCNFALKRAKQLSKHLKCRLSDILMVGTDEQLVAQIKGGMDLAGERSVQILHRGDLQAVQRGERENALIISHPDFVGGLEFKAVLIVGVDEGRMPPTDGIQKEDSRHFVSFKACNRLYVTITRARLAVEILLSKERGVSALLEPAIASQAITLKEAGSDSR